MSELLRAEIMRLRTLSTELSQELRDARMILAALVVQHGTRNGDQAKIEVPDHALTDAPAEIQTYRQLDPSGIVLVVRGVRDE